MTQGKSWMAKTAVLAMMVGISALFYTQTRDVKTPSKISTTTQKFADKVVIYTKAGCGYCIKAIALLQEEGIPFTRHDITEDMDKRRSLVAITGANTVPYIFIDHKFIGGYTDFVRLLQSEDAPKFNENKS